MSNEFYNPSGSPSTGATGSSAPMRAEFTAIAAGFALLPTMLAHGNEFVRVNSGGTALTTSNANAVATALGLVIGTNVQAWDADLDALAALDATVGILIKTAANTYVRRNLVGTANEITVTNGNGVAGNITLSLPAALTFTGKTVSGGIFNNVTVTNTAAAIAVNSGGTGVATLPQNNVLVGNGVGGVTGVSPGTANNVLLSNGNAWVSGAAPNTSGISVLAKSGAAVSCPADTNEDILATITIPANAMGANGAVRIRAIFNHTNSGNNKTCRIRLGGIGGTILATNGGVSTWAFTQMDVTIQNLNATNSQRSFGFVNVDAGAGPTFTNGGMNVTAAIDTTAQQTIVITGQKVSAGETLTLQNFTCELLANGT